VVAAIGALVLGLLRPETKDRDVTRI